MKLNVGCGLASLEGWTNIDTDPASAADRLMPAWDLAFADNSAEEIRALQLIEHLGYFKAKYFLSEAWRVLKPGGTLLLETPEIEKTFAAFLAGGPAVREAALGWVFGAETPGMGHAYCFPRELLNDLLTEAGFAPESAEDFSCGEGRPALRLLARKKMLERPALGAALRRRLLDRGLAFPEREEYAAGLEEAVKALCSAAGDPRRALEAALISAPAALEYFVLEEENERKASPEARACARLCAWGLQGKMAAEYEGSFSSGEEAACAAALAKGRELLDAALTGAGGEPAQEGAEAPPVFTPLAARAWVAVKNRRRSVD